MFNRRESDNFCTRWSGGVWWQTVLWDDVWAKNQLLTFQFLLIPPFQTSKDQLLTLNEDERDEYGTIHSSNRWERGGGVRGLGQPSQIIPKTRYRIFEWLFVFDRVTRQSCGSTKNEIIAWLTTLKLEKLYDVKRLCQKRRWKCSMHRGYVVIKYSRVKLNEL